LGSLTCLRGELNGLVQTSNGPSPRGLGTLGEGESNPCRLQASLPAAGNASGGIRKGAAACQEALKAFAPGMEGSTSKRQIWIRSFVDPHYRWEYTSGHSSGPQLVLILCR